MRTIDEFKQELQNRVSAAANVPRWPESDIERYMASFHSRRDRFLTIARVLVDTVVRPRLEAMAQLFSSARMKADEQTSRCSCWFAASERFPVTAKLDFAIEHDESIEHLFVRSDVYLMPVFFQFQPHDKLTLSLDQVDIERVTEWVETRIFEFLTTYLRHDRGAEDLDEDFVTDPVCGMRLVRSDTHEQASYRGHPYFFCSRDCREKFEGKPTDFVSFRTM